VNSVPFACHEPFRVQDSARLSCIRETKTNQDTIGEGSDGMKRRASRDARLIKSDARRTVDRCGEAL